jgi:hypothetical protein
MTAFRVINFIEKSNLIPKSFLKMILNSYTGFIKNITGIHADIRYNLSGNLFKPCTI